MQKFCKCPHKINLHGVTEPATGPLEIFNLSLSVTVPSFNPHIIFTLASRMIFFIIQKPEFRIREKDSVACFDMNEHNV